MKISSFNLQKQLNLFLSIFLFSLATRIALPPLIGHIPNFSPIDALALFCGVYFNQRSTAFFVILFSVWAGDLLLNRIMLDTWVLFYSGFYWQYACYCLIILLGTILKNKLNPIRLISCTLASSVLFFILSNFGVWFSGILYPFTLEGLIACYIAALPFFKNTLCSDLFFSVILFGVYEFLQRQFPIHLVIQNKHTLRSK